MPTGPLGPQGPTVDPNWAWDVPGWTNQGNTGDTIGAQLGGNPAISGNAFLGEPEGLSAYIARSMDPTVLSAAKSAGTLVTGTLYLAAMQVLEPVVSSKVVVSCATIGGTSTTYLGLYSLAGALVATTASIANIAASTISRNWVTSVALAPGVYYGAWLNTVAASGAVPNTNPQIAEQILLSGTTFPGTTLRYFSTGTGMTSGSLPVSLTTGFTGAGTVASYANNWFIGIA
jgi:hypothetical protein